MCSHFKPDIRMPLCVLCCRTLQDTVFQSYVSPEHYFLQIDPEAAGEHLGTVSVCMQAAAGWKGPNDCRQM
jgi:hypothetical protein